MPLLAFHDFEVVWVVIVTVPVSVMDDLTGLQGSTESPFGDGSMFVVLPSRSGVRTPAVPGGHQAFPIGVGD